MSNSQSLAVQPRATAPQWPLNLSRQQQLYDGLWVLFFLGTSLAFARPALSLGITGSERLFWLPAYLSVFVLLLPFLRQFLLLAQKNAIFMSWPLIACMSTLWSFAPSISFYHGLQLQITIMIGFVLFIHADLIRILQLIFSAQLICAIMSLLYVVLLPGQGISMFGEWQGVFQHKNTLGGMMAFQIITGICLFRHGWRPALCVAGTALALLLLMFSRSAAALVALVITLSAIPPALALRAGVKPFLLVLTAVLWMAAIVGFVVIELELDLVKSILQALGKDETLSSRTVLWDFAIKAIQERPWLGFGFKGYWNGEGTSAAMLKYEIGQDLWFFHNVFLETAVAFGFIGPILLITGLVYALYAALRLIAATRDFIWFWPLLFVVFTTVQCFAEYPLFVNHSLSQMILAATLATQWRQSILSPQRVAMREQR